VGKDKNFENRPDFIELKGTWSPPRKKELYGIIQDISGVEGVGKRNSKRVAFASLLSNRGKIA